jgi:hypothetical protein
MRVRCTVVSLVVPGNESKNGGLYRPMIVPSSNAKSRTTNPNGLGHEDGFHGEFGSSDGCQLRSLQRSANAQPIQVFNALSKILGSLKLVSTGAENEGKKESRKSMARSGSCGLKICLERTYSPRLTPFCISTINAARHAR